MKTVLSLYLSIFINVTFAQSPHLDTLFGIGGKVITTLPVADKIIALVEQSDGKIFACGEKHIARYLMNGDLDSSFGNNGILNSLTISNTHQFTDITINNLGQIYVLGYKTNGTQPADVILQKLRPNGVLDTSYGNSGLGENFYWGVWRSFSVVVDNLNDQVICSIGDANGQKLLRFNNDGSLDSTFNHSIGASLGSVSPIVKDIFIDDNGMLLVGSPFGCNSTPCQYNAVRIDLSSITRDLTYGLNGLASINGYFSTDHTQVAFRSDGSFHLGNKFYDPFLFLWASNYAAINSQGIEDNIFKKKHTGTQEPGIETIAISKTGKTFSAGSFNSNFSLTLLNKSAEKDTLCFPPVETDFNNTNDEAYAMIVTTNGDILVAGKSDSAFALARYNEPCSTVGLNESLSYTEISVFPNPSSGSFTLQFSQEPFSGQLRIYSLNGQLVHQQNIKGQNKLYLNLQLANGLYFIRISSRKASFSEHILINQNQQL